VLDLAVGQWVYDQAAKAGGGFVVPGFLPEATR
jgi:hypothetical protein